MAVAGLGQGWAAGRRRAAGGRGNGGDAEGAAVALDATKSNQQLVKAGKVWQLYFSDFEKE